ncbi:MAG TPA: hypothetical protein DC057_03740 [Spirochaetia bacterium]|nr:hypothetical protein [Spirochaetia bacterium]
MMNRVKYNLYILIGASIIIIISQLLSSFLTTSSFEKTYKETVVSRYRIVSKEIRKNVETAIDYGKPLDRFGDYNRIIDISSGEEKTGIKEIIIASPEGDVFYSMSAGITGKKVPFKRIPVFKNQSDEYTFDTKTVIYTALPLYYNKTDWTGVLYLGIDSKMIKDQVAPINQKTMKYYGFSLSLALFITILVLSMLLLYTEKSKKREMFISIIIFVILTFSQLGSGLVNNKLYEVEYSKLFNQNMKTLSRVVKTGFDFVLSLDIKIDRMKKAEEIIHERVKDNIECLEMRITDTNGFILYQGDKNNKSIQVGSGEKENFAANPFRIVTTLNSNQQLKGYLFVYMNREIIKEKQRNLILDILTVILISIVFGFEMMGFLHILIVKNTKLENAVVVQKSEDNMQIIRFTAFIFFFAELIPLSFMPIYINELFNLQPLQLFNTSRGTIMGLPISSYMLGVMIFVPLIGFITDRFGVRKILLSCSLLLFAGAILSAFSTSIIQLMIFRFISGAGYGGIIISSTNLIIHSIPDKSRTTGFGYWSAGFASAAICAVPIGGILVSRLGFRNVMIISGIAALILLLFIFVFIKKDVVIEDDISDEKKHASLSDFLCIFKNRNLLVNTLLSSIPYSLAFVGLFQYLFPLFMDNKGISQSDIGRVLTIFGIISLSTPFFSRIADKIKNDKLFIAAGNLINGVFLLLFLINPNIYIFILVIIGLGFGSMLTDAATESFITSTDTAKRIGEAKTLGIITTYEKLIAIFVPLTAGALISATGFINTTAILGIFIIISTILFIIFSTNPRKNEGKDE